MGCNQNCGLLTAAIIGAVLAILGGILIPVGNDLIEKIITKEAVIENGTAAYENWAVPGSPIYVQYWFFDVQNPEEVMENGSNPILQQKGPYTYKTQYRPKENITEDKDDTLSYFQPNIALFEPEMSVGPENDTVTIVNLAVVVAPVVFPNEHFQAMMDILITSSKSKFLQTRTVKEILWGYEDPFLKIAPISSIDKVVGIFYPYNETLDGPYRIYSGKDDIRKKGIIHSYKNNSTAQYWPSYCGMVNGTDGSSFAPFVSKSEVLRVFSSDICRSIHATYDSEQTVKDILLYRFMFPPSAPASPLSNPDSTCFCLDKETTQNCTLSGALDISSCKEEKPVIISLPHFLHGSKTLFQFVEGMKPNVEEHTTFLDVEPNTGFTLHFAKKLQINLLVKPNAKITALKNIKHEFIFPILWLNGTAIISDEKAGVFRSEVIGRIELLHLIQTLLIAIGSVMFLGFLIAFFICRRKSPK